MKIETFFEKFALFADAPDAVEKMRALLLNFAVTGRLSEQRAGDAPVSDLIDALSAAKAQRGKMRRRGVTAAVLTESVIDRPLDIPAHWAWVPLNEIGAMSGGMTPSKDKSAFWNGDVNWFSSKDIKLDELTESELKITREATEATGLQVYAPGCLVMVARSGILKRTFPVSILRSEGAVNQDLKVLSPFVTGLERYLQIMLRGMTGFILTSLVKTGMTVQSLKYEEFEAQPFPLPPLAEQKRIVTKVDELMALCDRLEAQQQERETRHAALAHASLARFADAPTPANLNFLFHPSYTISPADLRKSILTLAVQGKLVPQDPNDCEARAMIDCAMEKRKQTIKAKSLRSKEIDESADLFVHADLPSSWCVERFANLVDPENTISYGVLVPGNDVPDGIPFVRAQDLCLSNHPARPSKTIAAEIEKPYARTRLRGGEILLCVVGSIGKLGVVPDSWAGANIARAVARIKPIPDVLRDYLLLVLQEQSVQNYFISTTRTLAQPTLNVGMIEQTPIPVPPLAEQRRIVAKVEQLMVLVDTLEKQLTTSRTTAANLLAALVAELTGIPECRVASPAPDKPVAALPRPKPQKTTVATAKPAAQESTVSPRTLADLRKAAGLTQAAVAKAMGLNQAYISQMETGKRPITGGQRLNLMKIFGIMSV